MNKYPLVSIVIPAYNVASYLSKCIDSVICQSYKLWECILVDDGSIDETSAICDRYADRDSRIRVIHKVNEGVSIARNIGIENAKGTFICFIDADDWVNEDYLYKLITNSQFDIVFFPHREIYANGGSMNYQLREFETDDVSDLWDIVYYLKKSNKYRKNFFGFTWNKLFRLDIIKDNNIRFVKGLKTSEDEVFTLEYCININSIKVLSYPIYNYRILSNSLTKSKSNAYEQLLLARSFFNIIEKKTNNSIKRCFLPQIASIYCNAAMTETCIIEKIQILKEASKNINNKDARKYLGGTFTYKIFTSPTLIQLILLYIRKYKKTI